MHYSTCHPAPPAAGNYEGNSVQVRLQLGEQVNDNWSTEAAVGAYEPDILNADEVYLQQHHLHRRFCAGTGQTQEIGRPSLQATYYDWLRRSLTDFAYKADEVRTNNRQLRSGL